MCRTHSQRYIFPKWKGWYVYFCVASLFSGWSWLFLRLLYPSSLLHQNISRSVTSSTTSVARRKEASVLSSRTRITSPTYTTFPDRSLNTTTIANSTTTDSSHLAYLSLRDWEDTGMGGDRTCQTPRGIPDSCCLGGTDWAIYRPTVCNLSRPVYQRNEAQALSSLPQLGNRIPHRNVQCDACRLIDVMLEYNWTMAFVGDSVTRQSYGAFECELHRRDMYVVESKKVRFTPSGNRSETDRYGIRFIRELRVSKQRTTGSSRLEQSSPTAIIRFYFMYRPDLAEVQQYIAGRHDIVIFDHGLHYHAHRQSVLFSLDMTNLVTLLRGSGEASNEHNVSLKLLAWRETSAQHFAMPTGHYDPNLVSTSCVPHQYQEGIGNERRQAMKQVVQAMNWTKRELVILPFREYSSQFHELHVGGKDCSHFCSTPSFWLYQWRQIRTAMEDALLSWQHGHIP
jgi:hypothetical protein